MVYFKAKRIFLAVGRGRRKKQGYSGGNDKQNFPSFAGARNKMNIGGYGFRNLLQRNYMKRTFETGY